jgi:hypothetical protein
MSYQRINGGEKNLNSGVRWTKDEIFEVYKLYKNIKGVSIHEHNPEIQKLASVLGRTVRSTEAQTLMFRNLERGGLYSHGNMNKLSKEIWDEYETKLSVYNNPMENMENSEDLKPELERPSYFVWNKLLIDFYFNPTLKGQEIACFPVSEEIFEEISNNKYFKKDFFDSIKISIGPLNFIDRLNELYFGSLGRVYNGKKIRKPQPDYFGFLIFLIYALSQDDKDDVNLANVYDRLNHFGGQIFENKWKEINSFISRDILEPIWENLEEWSTVFKKGELGLFYRRDPKNAKRCYVSRIERHSLFNSKQFSVIIDYLISDGYRPESILSVEEWIVFFKKHKIPKSELIIEYLSDESKLQISVLSFLNSYLKSHFDDETIASDQNKYRVPPVKLKVCIKSLPLFPNDPIEDFYLRAYSEGLEDDLIKTETNEYIKIKSYNHLYSDPIYLNFNLESGIMLSGIKNRYITNKNVYWLSKDQKMNEWIEMITPSNQSTFLLIISAQKAKKFNEENLIKSEVYTIENLAHVVIQFNSLNEHDFDKVYNLFNPYSKIEGKIEVVSNFVLERRTSLLKEFNPRFRYIGNSSDPQIIAIDVENKQELCALSRVKDSVELYELPEKFSFDGFFQIRELNSQIKTRYNLKIGSLNQVPTNIQKPILKNHEGRNDSQIQITDADIYDIPASFNRDFDIPKFNSWHSNLFRLFNSKLKYHDVSTIPSNGLIQTSGDKLLQFVGLNNTISTYEFPKLLRELDSDISISYSKIMMEYWRHLGYINFQDYGEYVKISPTSLFFLQTSFGLKALLTGYRNKEILEKLISVCFSLNLNISYEFHSDYKEDLLPAKIIISDSTGQLNKFKNLGNQLGLFFVNEIDNPLNPRYVVYQLACFYSQRSVEEFRENLKEGLFYEDTYGRTKDHRRKRIYNLDKLIWEDSVIDIESIKDGTVVRYEGFEDKSMVHILKFNNRSVLINDVSMAIFSSLTNDILLKEELEGKEEFNFYVPLYIRFPFWIERGLILLNGNVPLVKYINGFGYRIYEKVNGKILDVIENKLGQKINKL